MTQHHHDDRPADAPVKKPRHKKFQTQSYGERMAAQAEAAGPSTGEVRDDTARGERRGGPSQYSDRGVRGYANDRRDNRPVKGYRAAEPRTDRRPANRDDRPQYNRDERPQYNRDDRPQYNRDERPQYGDRARTDRGERNQYGDRPQNNRNDRNDRNDRPQYDRGDRPSFNRDERPQYDRTERPQYRRDDRPRFERDERPRVDRDERPRFDRDERPRYDRAGDRQSSYQRRDRDDRSSYQQNKRVEEPVDLGTVAADNQFAALGLAPRLVQRLARDGITSPFPIQTATIPDALAGKDVLGRGQTGSGKTLGFGLPTLTRLAGGKTESRRPRGMILVPTRELAMQVHDALEPLAHVMNVSLKLIAGGLPYPKQIESLRRGVDLLIATPGRLIDLCEQGAADLGAVEIAVLDEADHMCDMGFMPAVTTLLDMTPAEGQRLLFSATLDNDVDTIVKTYLKDPVQHSTESGQASVSTMEHHMLVIEPGHKQSLTAELASRDGRTIVFVRTKLGADRVATQLRDRGVMAAALHGGLTQGMRNRTLDQFKDGSVPVLVATDVAARGIHVDDVGLVVQADPPAEHKDYLHRAGRTARAGGKGAVVTLVLPHQRRGMMRMAESAGVKAEPVRARPGDELVTELTGGSKPSGYPVKLPAPKPQRFNKGGGKRFGSSRPGRGHDGRGGSGPRRSNGPRRTDGNRYEGGKSYQH
ncbi:superfamily II DNA/RNA helicase [Kribbella antiqua]|uniref:Superfamily II DNA/RNA helicase n=1 Tax=Kribbella antiqua TaxID=2512217 RepID=A0A4R2IHY3_9ACTN|nr:DEAD/DEAH box helicase [Kribbella antiqua]TCO44097.1 superfamily II DNA/RNA helicase [Kribbella antiqua]